jgi:hypothetical protein
MPVGGSMQGRSIARRDRRAKSLDKPSLAAKTSLRMENKTRASWSVMLLSSIFLSSSPAAPLPPNAKPYTGKALAPASLRCEYRVDPLGIEEPAPRLSWIVESGERGQRQTACRLLVASSEKLLSKDQGDLWDTGKLPSDETIGTAYQGQPLVSQQRCFLQVQVCRGRDVGCPTPPSQIPAGGFPAPGSSSQLALACADGCITGHVSSL